MEIDKRAIGGSSTSNSTGVYNCGSWADGGVDMEYAAGIWDTSNSYMNKIREADSRYYDLYTKQEGKIGDGTDGFLNIKNYIGESLPIWNVQVFGRLSCFTGASRGMGLINGGYNSYMGSRAVVVCGTGF